MSMISIIPIVLASVFGYVIHVGPAPLNVVETERMRAADRKARSRSRKPARGTARGGITRAGG